MTIATVEAPATVAKLYFRTGRFVLPEFREGYGLRFLSQVSAGLLGAHVTLLATYLSIGMIGGILVPSAFRTVGKFLLASGVVNLAVFCVSVQNRPVAKDND